MPDVSSEKAESVLYKAFNSSINIIMAISTIEKGVFIDVNKAFLKLSGFTKDEVIGRSSIQLGIISSETRDRMKQILIEKGQVDNFEIIFKSKDYKLSRLLLFAEIITIDGNQQLFTIVHDITELVVAKSELEKEKAILQAVFDSTPDAFVLKDCNSVYLKVNPAFCNFFDVKESQAVGKNDFDFFPQSEAAKFRKEDQKIIKTGITSEYDRELKTSNHGAIWYQTIKTPIKDSNGSIAGILCSARDITKRKYLEDMHNVRLGFRSLKIPFEYLKNMLSC